MTLALVTVMGAVLLAAAPAQAQPAAAAAGKPAWSVKQGAEASPVWPLSALPADLKPVGMERLEGLKIGMRQDEVGQLLDTPHSAVIATAAAGEVWQYVVLDAADGRAFIVSIWFDHRGLWMVSPRSNPVGRLAVMQFVTAPPAAAAAPKAAPPVVAMAPLTAPAAAPPAAVATPAPPPAPSLAPLIAMPPALSTPSAAIETAPTAAPAPEAALRDAVDDWLSAWRQKDAAAYIAHYTADYAPPGKKRQAWVGERRERLAQPVFIRISIDDVQVLDAQSAHPKVSFVQDYESERYSEKSRKVLTFVSQGGRWLIEKEDNAKLAR